MSDHPSHVVSGTRRVCSFCGRPAKIGNSNRTLDLSQSSTFVLPSFLDAEEKTDAEDTLEETLALASDPEAPGAIHGGGRIHMHSTHPQDARSLALYLG